MKKLFYCAALAVASLMGLSSCGHSVPSVSLHSDLDTLGYAYGVMFGTQYSNFQDSGVVVPGETMDLDYFLDGFFTAITRDSSALKMTQEEANLFLQEFNNKLRKKIEAERQEKIDANKAKGADFMAENAKKDGVICLESGLQIEHVVAGTGISPEDVDKVLVNYKGTLVDGTVFDENDSVEFSCNGVVKGFKEGLMNMKEGGKAILTMPSDIAYGDRGAGQMIEGGSTLQFEVELLKVNKAEKKSTRK
ncbi:MAG: FKBP-type peptidyl-prolyl cis-trans isomerase [Bacteroidales bacterium]|nr:FKBP-type peptidyl-prolyl cis-trans isomerase [Candidatus Liminaster caballi]